MIGALVPPPGSVAGVTAMVAPTVGNTAAETARSRWPEGTTDITGLWLLEDIELLAHGIKSRNWVETGLGGFAATMDGLGLALDPLGELAATGIAWLIEHYQPLRDAFDGLAGKPAQIAAHAQTWRAIATRLDETAATLGAGAQVDLVHWGGAVGHVYRTKALRDANVIAGLAKGARTLADGVESAGQLVATVRTLVRDIIAEFAATVLVRIPVWLLLEGVTCLVATPLVLFELGGLVARFFGIISRFVRALVTSVGRLAAMLGRLHGIFGELQHLLRQSPSPKPLGGAGRQTGGSDPVALATATRTADGGVDPAAMARFVDALPRIELTQPGDTAALARFASEATGLERVVLEPVGAGAGKGLSGAPVFLVRDESGALVAVAKLFPDSRGMSGLEGMAREISSLDRLGADEFTRFGVPEVRGAAVVDLPDGTRGGLVMQAAQGRSLFEMMSEMPPPGSAARPAAMAELSRAVDDAAAALAELHTRPAGSGGPVSPAVIEYGTREIGEKLALVTRNADLARMYAGLDVDELARRVDEVVTAARHDPGGASLAHGDANLGNVFWHPERGITFIDMQSAHRSMDVDGMPIGTPARDLAEFSNRVGNYPWRFPDRFGFTDSELADLQARFMESYLRSGGATVPGGARQAYDVSYALGDLARTLQDMRAAPVTADDQVRLARYVNNLREVLGWKP
jgi:hypothetical protein